VSSDRSFAHAVVDALDGIYHTLVEQPHFGPAQWAIVTLSCAFVLGAELFNTCLEHTIDLYEPNNHPLARAAKHAGAAAVLVAAAAAAIVGVLVYGSALLGK
jgi:diacylglycerol kinase